MSKNKKYEFGDVVVNQTYAGQAAYPYLSAALKSGATLANNWITIHENIQHKLSLQTVSTDGNLADATCDFAETTTTTLADNTIELKELMFGADLCKKTLRTSWEAESMGSHINGRVAPQFEEYIIAYYAAIIAEQVENGLWNGNGSNALLGFRDATAGVIRPGNTTHVQASATLTGANVIAEGFNAAYGKAASDRSAILSKADLAFYVSTDVGSFYKQNLSASGGFSISYDQYGGNIPMDYLGTPIHVCPGLPGGTILLTYESNLHFATNLLTDWSNLGVINRTPVDGSDNIRIYGKFAAGVGVGTPEDVVSCTTSAN